MKKKLVWRLGKLPSPDEVRELVKDKIITQEEARDILFNSDVEPENPPQSAVSELKSEIKFLRELIEKLSSRTETIRVIETIQPRYIKYPWYNPYIAWCSSNSITNASYCGNTTTTDTATFSNINTF